MPYYEHLLVQARYIYSQSELYRLRRNEQGMEFAENAFEENVDHFFWKAKKEPFQIRARIFFDSLVNKKPRAYFLFEWLR